MIYTDNKKKGFTLSWRSLWDYGYHEDHLLFTMIHWFKDFACYEDKKIFSKGEVVKLKRGQVLFGRDDLAIFLKTTPGKVRARVNFLKKVGFLTTEPTNKGTIGTIVNYNEYQKLGLCGIQKQPAEQPEDEPALDQHSTTTKELNKEIKEYSPNSVEFRTSELLLNLILERKPDYKKPSLQKWAQQIDYMIRIDKRSPKDIQEVIQWSQQDDFWQNNILSTSKLRKQFDQLKMKYDNSDFKRMIEDYTYNNPIWQKIFKENRKPQEYYDEINRQQHEERKQKEKEEANRKPLTPEQKAERKRQWQEKRSKVCQKLSMSSDPS